VIPNKIKAYEDAISTHVFLVLVLMRGRLCISIFTIMGCAAGDGAFSQPEGESLPLVDDKAGRKEGQCNENEYFQGNLASARCVLKPWWFDKCKDDEVWSESGKGCVERPWSDFVECVFEINEGAEGCDDNEWVQQHCNESCALLEADRKELLSTASKTCYSPSGAAPLDNNPADGVALLFLVGRAWSQQEIWERFLTPIRDQVKVFVHSDVQIGAGISNMFPAAQLKDSVPCSWGELMECILRLLQEALKDPQIETMVLLGPRTIPLKKPLGMLSSLRKGASRSRLCFFPPNHHSVLKRGEKQALMFKAQAWFTLNRRHAEIIVSHLINPDNSFSASRRDNICRRQRVECRGAPDECCLVRILQEAGVLGEVEDNCDMFLWWRDDDGKLTQQKSADTCITETGDTTFPDYEMTADVPCALPRYCNGSLYQEAGHALLGDTQGVSEHSQESPRVFHRASKKAIQDLIASPFLYGRKFEASDDLTQLLTDLLELQ
jgi:hypothetical protein